MKRQNYKKGFGLIEIIVASAVIGLVFFSLTFVFILASRLVHSSSDRVRANFLAEEGIEAMHFLRDKSWSGNLAGLSSGINYYLTFNSGTSIWTIGTTNPGTIDGLFTRKIQVAAVSRDSSDDIVSSGGTNDADSKLVKSIVTWLGRGTTQTVEVDTYLSNIFNN